METGANIVRRYAKSEPVERIDIICAHYENFTSIIDSFEVGVFHLIPCEKAYNRQKRKGDLGVRIQDGKGHSDPTAKQAVENVMIMEAIRGCDFSGDFLKDTENADEHRRDICS